METWDFNTILTEGKFKGKTVSEVFNKNKKFIFNTIKEWCINGIRDKEFSDDVLREANISKTIHSVNVISETTVVDKDNDGMKLQKKLKKDNKSFEQIVSEIENIEC